MARVALKLWVLTVVATSVAVLMVLPREGLAEQLWTVLLLAALAALVGGRPVRIPALKTELTATHPFVFCALAAFGPLAAALVDIFGVLGTTSGQDKRPKWIRLAFNLGTVVLSTGLAYVAFLLAGGTPGARAVSLLWPLAAATAAYFLTNTGLVAVAIALERTEGFLATWRHSFQWTTVSFFSGLTLAVGLVFLLEMLGPWGLALGVPPSWLLLAFYRAYKDRLEEQQARIDEVEALNWELERKVAERTREVQQALGHIAETNQRLRETNERLVKANRAKSEFLANVSHELRTPLNAILGFSDLLMDRSFGNLEEQQQGFVADIRDSGEHLLELINDILDLSKIEAVKMRVRRQAVTVPEALGDVVAMMQSLAGKKEIDLSLVVEADVGEGSLDRGMFRQILINLLSNAVKFTPSGGRITVGAVRRGADLEVEVRDTGIGIPQENHEKIFQEFFQVDGSYSRSYQGTGLGLALVRRMMELHGGGVSLESSPGNGACFTCHFPECMLATRSTTEIPKEEKPADGEASGGSTILIVEDNRLNRKLVRNALQSRGHRVVEAVSGEEALEMARTVRPDLVLMDLQLPGLDGLEVTRRLKADPATAQLRIVALTAFARSLDQERAQEAGCLGYITKPIRLSSFPAQIESYLIPKEGAA